MEERREIGLVINVYWDVEGAPKEDALEMPTLEVKIRDRHSRREVSLSGRS